MARAQHIYIAHGQGRTNAHAPNARLRLPETPVQLPVSLFDSFGEFICSKGSSSIRYRVDWCINHRLQSNQFVGRRVEEENGGGLTDFRV